MTHAIWWTSEPDCYLVEALGAPFGDWPDYLRDEWCARFGRNGRARLWVAPCLDWDDNRIVPLKDGTAVAFGVHPLGNLFSEGWIGVTTWAGIVLRACDSHHVVTMPGLVTDESLRPLRLAPTLDLHPRREAP